MERYPYMRDVVDPVRMVTVSGHVAWLRSFVCHAEFWCRSEGTPGESTAQSGRQSPSSRNQPWPLILVPRPKT